MNGERPRMPIGYWLKQADQAITERVNAVQAANGVSRTDWQVLNLLHEQGGARLDQLLHSLGAFVDRAGLEEILSGLTARGWVVSSGDGSTEFLLTQVGQHAHAAILASQKEVRQQAMEGISEEDYATVIRVLQRIVQNLGGELQGEGHAPGRKA